MRGVLLAVAMLLAIGCNDVGEDPISTQRTGATPVPFVAPAATARPKPTKQAPAPPAEVYFKNCSAARAAGAAPIRRGEPGYRPALDRDNDGVACE